MVYRGSSLNDHSLRKVYTFILDWKAEKQDTKSKWEPKL